MFALIFNASRFLSTVNDGRNKGSNAGSFNAGIPWARYGVIAFNCFNTHLSYCGRSVVRGQDCTPGAAKKNRRFKTMTMNVSPQWRMLEKVFFFM
ncbi:hypothetical protein WH47_07075 [Habropoda laboriosa]|uniref:Uncharacterized protein n=1 Tax=Habropoda laboriosa TaxID=597456 RepID=A0A0L7RG97_9HYME|nr:hypothetical protein WH47_07075 [Habropoda laboriosa]